MAPAERPALQGQALGLGERVLGAIFSTLTVGKNNQKRGPTMLEMFKLELKVIVVVYLKLKFGGVWK